MTTSDSQLNEAKTGAIGSVFVARQDDASPVSVNSVTDYLATITLGLAASMIAMLIGLIAVGNEEILEISIVGWQAYLFYALIGLLFLASAGFTVSSFRQISRTQDENAAFEAEMEDRLQQYMSGDPDHWIYTAVEDDSVTTTDS